MGLRQKVTLPAKIYMRSAANPGVSLGSNWTLPYAGGTPVPNAPRGAGGGCAVREGAA